MPAILYATIWRELRWRLLAALLLVVPPAALVAWSYLLQARRTTTGAVAPGSDGYLGYLDAAWFWLPGPSAVFLPAAVLVGTGGGLLRRRADLTFLLALPVSRRRWLLTHLAMALAALGALVLVVTVVLAAGACRAAVPLPLGAILVRSLAVLAAASAWVGVTIGVLAVARSPALTTVLVLGAVVVQPTTYFRLDLPVRPPPPPLLPTWDPWMLADPRAWHQGVPLPSLLVTAALGTAGVLFALHRLERFEP